jgi:hypothetical protein
MSEFHNTSDSILQRAGRRWLVAALLIGLASTVPSFADTPEIEPDRSVSTSPTAATAAGSSTAESSASTPSSAPPLTRAATRRRIDEMSPAGWLSQFGRVSIGRRE